MNMKKWTDEYLHAPCKKAMPLLSFPGIHIIDHTVDELVHDGHLQALCMDAIARRYPTGASVSLMDLSVEAEAFGAEVIYSVHEVPTVQGTLIKDMEDAERLIIPRTGAGRTGTYIECIRETKKLITDRPVFAGIIGPYSLAGRLLDMTEIMVLCYEDPEMVHIVLEKASEFLIRYAQAFKQAGADGIIMAEPAAGLLSPNLIKEFSNPYVKKIIDKLEDDHFLFIYHNCGDISAIIEQIREINASVYSVGNAIDMETALKALPENSMIIGNIDPAGVLLHGTPEMIREKTAALLNQCCKYKNFVIASGCDIPPAAPLENIDAFFAAVEEFYHKRT